MPPSGIEPTALRLTWYNKPTTPTDHSIEVSSHLIYVVYKKYIYNAIKTSFSIISSTGKCDTTSHNVTIQQRVNTSNNINIQHISSDNNSASSDNDNGRGGLETICVSSPKYSMYFFSLFFFFSLFTNCIFTIRLRVQQESQQPGLPPLPTPGMTKERARDAGLGTATRHQHHQLQDRRSGSRVRVGGGEENRLKRMPDASVWALSTCFFFHLFFLY